MKRNSILAVLLLLLAGLQTAMAQKMVVTTTDNQVVKYDVNKVKHVTFEEEAPIETIEYVDLGLPSGTLWATCNVGASKPEEYGDYFAWGEIETKSDYSWSTCKYCKGSSLTLTKYCTLSNYGYNGFTDNLTELQPEDDAATANWGSGWQMPSLDQIKELYNSIYTTTEWTQVNGVNGRKITSKSNGNSVFLPATGYRYDTSLIDAGRGSRYWSRSLDAKNSGNAWYLSFGSGYIDWGSFYRCEGRSVRPVRVQE